MVGVTVLFRFLGEDRRRAKAPFGWKVAKEADYVPHLVIIQNALPRRHTTHADTVLEDPFELSIGVFLDVIHCKIGNGWRHLVGEGYAGVLTIQAMADLAMVLEVFPATFAGSFIVGNRIRSIFASDHQLFCFLRYFVFHRVWRGGFAPRQHHCTKRS